MYTTKIQWGRAIAAVLFCFIISLGAALFNTPAWLLFSVMGIIGFVLAYNHSRLFS